MVERLAEKTRIRTIAAAIEMADALAARGIETACETYRDETHMSVLPVAVNRALRWAFALDRAALPLWPAPRPEETA